MSVAAAVVAPVDPALPRLAALLDRDRMQTVLARSLAPDSSPFTVTPYYLRYKPSTNLVVHYRVEHRGIQVPATAMIASKAYLARRTARNEHRALAHAAATRSPAVMPLRFEPELDALIQWYPLDLQLPALAASPATLTAGLRLPDPGGAEPQLLAYKPRRRATMRLGGATVKLYAKADEYRAAIAGIAASASLDAAPRLLAVDDALRATAQSWLDGAAPSDPFAVAQAAGTLAAAVHATPVDGLPPAPPAVQLEAAAASAHLGAVLVPRLTERLTRLLARLSDTAPTGLKLSAAHGDFSPAQLVTHCGRLAVVDFDAGCAAPAALDLATFASYLVDTTRGLTDAVVALDLLTLGHGGLPPALPWYFATAILRRAPRPFRYLKPDWQVGVEAMVTAAETALTW